MQKPVRPRPAASLILLREGPGGLEVLLGRRGGGARFMPGRYVFPGGRVQGFDARAWSDEAPSAEPAQHAHRRAALRETFEETGLLIGQTGACRDCPPATPVEKAYRERGIVPLLDALVPVGRAITPSRSPIRFHGRFFLADGALALGTPEDSNELEDLGWRAVERGLPDMADVTEFMLKRAVDVRRGADTARSPLYHYVRQVPRVSWLAP